MHLCRGLWEWCVMAATGWWWAVCRLPRWSLVHVWPPVHAGTPTFP